MPNFDFSIGLPGLKVIEVKHDNPLIIEVKPKYFSPCPYCGSLKLRNKDLIKREVRHESWGERVCKLIIFVKKYHCLDCKKYFRERVQGLNRYQRVTQNFKKEICQKHHLGISQRSLTKVSGVGNATIERWYHQYLDLEYRKKQDKLCPRVLGIDEHFFSKKHGYATTLVDLERRKVFDVVLGRSELALRNYLSKLKGRDRVELVSMDLSETYRSLVKKYFPNASIVADRFHVIRTVNWAFIKVWQSIDPNSKHNRGLLSLMRRHEWRLRPDQKINLLSYLKEHSGLEVIYNFKQDLCKILTLKTLREDQCKREIPKLLGMVDALRMSPMDILRTLGKTLQSWIEEIGRMLRYTRSNAITEGMHNKMEVISRRAYGFRNFENYRLRVMVMCG